MIIFRKHNNYPTFRFIIKISVFLLFLFLFTDVSSYAQISSGKKKKLFKKAMYYFNNEEYVNALPLFLELDSLYPKDMETNYYIGACYLNTRYQKTKGIPYLEFAIKNGESLLPKAVFLDLGTLYHLNYQFDQAEYSFQRFIHLANKSDYEEMYASRMIEVCKNAKEIMRDTLDVITSAASFPINTEASETHPIIAADESTLFFTRTQYQLYQGLVIDSVQQILFSEKVDRHWATPKALNFQQKDNSNYQLIGASPDGAILFFFSGDQNSGDLYIGKLTNDIVENLEKLPYPINTEFWEGNMSMTPDGRELYFSSNRPGGYGGKDIYKSIHFEDGSWSKPINLGPMINTDKDEDAPFIHPDKQTLYFSSNGHKTMGGYDIFESYYLYLDNDWTNPKNIGYPINTPGDDLGFVISADGNSAYFASNKGNILGHYDLYKVILHQTIPLTLVKGIIHLVGQEDDVNVSIKIIDKETNKRVKYIYNPNPKTGKYLMIFPPNKNYDMVIEAQGYYPYLININIPNQTYFYELFQDITLKQIVIGEKDSAIGQEIIIRNTFYDLYKTPTADSILANPDTANPKRYEKLLNLIEEIINQTDSIGMKTLDSLSSVPHTTDTIPKNSKNYDRLLDIIEDAIETTDSVTLQILDESTKYDYVTSRRYFYDSDRHKPILNARYINGDTLYTLPALKTASDFHWTTTYLTNTDTSVSSNNLSDKDFSKSKPSIRRYVLRHNIFFETNSSSIDSSNYKDLEDILILMLQSPELGIELHGYADSRGSEENNLNLSKERAINVLEYFVNNNITPQRCFVSGHGETENVPERNEEDLKKNRKVEIAVFEILTEE